MSIDTLAAALELKPESEHLHAHQRNKKLVRRNASDKLKLIQMVHDNPILWDSRLPNFKGAEGEKSQAWERIGKEFNAPGRRVARAFKSLRESYRRELAHVKLMGNNFKPKWSLYEAMDFLRDVIRERKGCSQSTENTQLINSTGLNLSSAFGLQDGDLSHHHHHLNTKNNSNSNNRFHSHNENSSNSNIKNNNNSSNCRQHHSPKLNNAATTEINAQHHSSAFINASVTALNLSKCSSSSLSLSNEDLYKFVKPELDLSNHQNNSNNHNNSVLGVVAAQKMAAHVSHARQHRLNNQQNQYENSVSASIRPSTPISRSTGLSVSNDSCVTSTHNDNNNAITSCNSTQHALYDENGDGADESSIRSDGIDCDGDNLGGDGDRNGDDNNHTHAGHTSGVGSNVDEVEELDAIDADFPYPFILDSNSTTNGCIVTKRSRKDMRCDNDDDEDDYEMKISRQHRRLRRHQPHAQGHLNGVNAAGSHLMLDIPQPQTVREVLNSKFCGFISAKLNSMEDSEADNLMNKILMLLVQTQTTEIK